MTRWTPFTRSGDKGFTTLPPYGRLPKSHPLVEVVGCIDEAATAVMLAESMVPDTCSREKRLLEWVASVLMVEVGGSVMKASRGSADVIGEVEKAINMLSRGLAPRDFILPGGHPSSATIHLARSIVRRLERRMVELREKLGEEAAPDEVLALVNRLGDLLFVVALSVNRCVGVAERALQRKLTPIEFILRPHG